MPQWLCCFVGEGALKHVHNVLGWALTAVRFGVVNALPAFWRTEVAFIREMTLESVLLLVRWQCVEVKFEHARTLGGSEVG